MTTDGHCGPLGATLSHQGRSAGGPICSTRHRTAETRYTLGRNESRRVPLCQLCHLCHLCHAPALAQRRGDGPQ
jgi:hypothetical protein